MYEMKNSFTPVCSTAAALRALLFGMLLSGALVPSIGAMDVELNDPGLAIAIAAQDAPRVSPFDMVRWKGHLPEVRLDDQWYSPRTIFGVDLDKILTHAKKTHGDRWDKRFCEDLPQLLMELGRVMPANLEIPVTMVEVGSDEVITRVVPMTASKREAIHRAKPRISVTRVERKHASKPVAKYAFLTRRYRYQRSGPEIRAEHAAQDLDQLEAALESQFSYLALQKVKYRAALDTIRAGLGDAIDLRDFHIQLRKLIALFGDGHSRVSGVSASIPQGWLLGAVVWIDGRYAYLDRNGSPVEEGFPWIERIEGLPVARAIEKAELLCARGSDALRLRSSQDYLAAVDFLQQELDIKPRRVGVEKAPQVSLRLGSVDSKSRHNSLFTPHSEPPRRPDPFPQAHRLFDDGIGYLRLPSMSSNKGFLDSLDTAMAEYKDTVGLVIDVRGNSGGSRHALMRLLPYFLDEAETRVVNVAAYRLPKGITENPEGHLNNRFLYPMGSQRWSEDEVSVLKTFAKKFRPKWKLKPKGAFSDWHYFALSRHHNSKAYRYDKPVILLIDEGCFSATDIFAGAFEGNKQVTLMGRTTGGGSGRSQRVGLAHSGLTVRLSSMASFRPAGQLYDGVGIKPKISATLQLTDYTEKKHRDSVLEAACKRLLR